MELNIFHFWKTPMSVLALAAAVIAVSTSADSQDIRGHGYRNNKCMGHHVRRNVCTHYSNTRPRRCTHWVSECVWQQSPPQGFR
jgi:hypothetical protein